MPKLVPEFIQVLPRAFIAQAAFLGYWQESFVSRFQCQGSRLISICDTVQFVTDLSYAPWSAGIWATTSEAKSGLARLGITSVLSLVFTDATPSSVSDDDLLFSAVHAQQILDFVASSDSSPIFVHCAAGISRSGAVGEFLCRYFNLDSSAFHKQNPHIRPNPHVLSVLMQQSGLRDDYQKSLSQVFV